MDQATLWTTYARFLGVKYVNVGAATFAVCENFANLEREIDLIWRSKWSSLKVLYLLARYMPYVQIIPQTYLYTQPTLNHAQCRATAKMAWVGVFTGAVFCAILQQRLHAIYNQALWVKVSTTIMFIATIIGVSSIAGLHVGGDIQAVSGYALCIASVPQSYYALWIPPMVFDFFMVVLVCFKAVEHVRVSYNSPFTGCRLMMVIARDSILYFVCGFAMYLLNMLVWLLCPPDYVELGPMWTSVITSAAITRMTLNLREEYRRASQPGLGSHGVQSTWGLQFSPVCTPSMNEEIEDRPHNVPV